MELKDELCPKFLKQPGWSMTVGFSGSVLGNGVGFYLSDEHENDMDTIFIQSKSKIEALRDELNELLMSDEIKWEEFKEDSE